MAHYSPAITEGPHLHPSLPKGLPFSTMSPSKPVISEYTLTSLAIPPPAICPDSFFCPLVCFPQQVDLERGLIHLLSCTLPSSHPALLPCVNLTLHYRIVSLITPFFFWPFSASSTLTVMCQEKPLHVQCSLPEHFLTQLLSSLLPFPHQLALGTCLIRANVSPAEIQKVSIFLFAVEQNCWHFSTFPFSTFLGNLKMITVFSNKGGDLQEHVTLDVLWFSKGKAESHAVLEKPEQNWIKLSRTLKWHLKASHCFCWINLFPLLFQNTFPGVLMPLIITYSSIKWRRLNPCALTVTCTGAAKQAARGRDALPETKINQGATRTWYTLEVKHESR